jgi:hypothetical protein
MFEAEEGRRDEADALFARAARMIEDAGVVLLRSRLIVYRLYFLRNRMPERQMVTLLNEALTLTESVRDFRFSAAPLTSLGDLAFVAGDAARAVSFYERAERRYEEVGFLTAVPLVRLPLALAHWLGEDLSEAQRWLGELAYDWGRPSPNLWFAKVAMAGLLAELGERERAVRLFDECASADSARTLVATRFLTLLRLLLEPDTAAGLAILDEARSWPDETPGSSSEIALAHVLVTSRLQRRGRPLAASAPRISIPPDGSWFAVGGAAKVSLGRRPALRRLLLALKEAGPDGWLTADAAFAAGWPGESGVGRSASFRVYSGIKRLRALGLGAALETGPGGYRLRGGSVSS